MTKTTSELEKELQDLLDRQSEVKNEIFDLNSKLRILESELLSLNDGYRSKGLISIKKQEIEDSMFPVYELTRQWSRVIAYRIVNVTDKLIYIKRDGNNEPEKYTKSTGWKFRARSSYGAIDAEKALKIWQEWESNNG